MTVWQVGAGDWGRDYSRLCIDHDVMIIGPGDPGGFRNKNADYSSLKSREKGMVKSFCYDVKRGDIVLLRRQSRLVAIGIVPENSYSWEACFDDIYGWDLQHCQRVCWQKDFSDELNDIQASGDLLTTIRTRFSRVHSKSILNPIEHLFKNCIIRELKSLPKPCKELSEEEISKSLISHGLSHENVKKLLAAINRQRHIVQWYSKHGEASGRPSEHEVVAYMILPMLLALGWSEQLLAVEWKRVDLAAFQEPPIKIDNCVMICEAKKIEDGLQDTFSQAEKYVTDLKLSECNRIVLTQGGRFYVYSRESSGQWGSEPVGYINIEKMRRHSVVPAGTDAIDTIMMLRPQHA